MADADLEEIRAARLAQLRQQGGSPSDSDSKEEQQRQRANEARASILTQILTPPSLDRLNRIRLVKESRATMVEDRLIALARSGQLRQKIDEEQLKEILAGLSEQEEKNEDKVVVRRKGGAGGGRWDDDDDLEDLLNDV
ncbi:DNA-binding TFAR19-related protein [Aulographum hederae CBS 113979]|uniref:DNA-binding TFAR19-related protein n=1 Tax=Aulographum hederae CBS 113979 TaxID=1176131 RepID=A0A6G1GSL4_9PEZI|nr:DNA-binding TFAR19-related protein [Aulographum hederae CBS 113979]